MCGNYFVAKIGASDDTTDDVARLINKHCNDNEANKSLIVALVSTYTRTIGGAHHIFGVFKIERLPPISVELEARRIPPPVICVGCGRYLVGGQCPWMTTTGLAHGECVRLAVKPAIG